MRLTEHGNPVVRSCACGQPIEGGHRRVLCVSCRFWAKVNKGPDCWIWTSNQSAAGGAVARQARPPKPYGTFFHGGKPRKAHHIAWELTYGTIPDGLEILHTCDVRLCVRPDHLRVGTHADNMADASSKGHLNVSRPGKQKVTPEQIEVMRSRVAAGETQLAVASDFGIARTTLSEILAGKRRQYDAPLRPSLEQAG